MTSGCGVHSPNLAQPFLDLPPPPPPPAKLRSREAHKPDHLFLTRILDWEIYMAASQPPELIEQILDELNGDLPSLRACALLHSSWVPASQERLFHTVSVDRVDKWNSLVQLLQIRPHIRALIRRLEWAIPRAGKRSVAIAEPSPALFPRVEHLVCKHGPLRDALLYGLPSLVTVELSECDKFGVDPALAKRINIASELSSDNGGSLAVANLIVFGVTRIHTLSLAEWIEVCVRWKTLRTLAISLPRLVDGPSHRSMYGTLRSLEELVLSVQSDLGGSGSSILGILESSSRELFGLFCRTSPGRTCHF
jgi:hypothetical protein